MITNLPKKKLDFKRPTPDNVYSFWKYYCRVWGSRSGRANQLAAHYSRSKAKLV